MRSLTKSVLSLFVAGATSAAALSQVPAQPVAPAGQPTGQPGVTGQTAPAQPGQLPRGINPTTPAPIAPPPGQIAPPPGQIGAPTQPIPGQPGAPQTQPIPGQPGAPQTQPIPGQPGAPQVQPIPGQPGAPQTRPIPGQPGAAPGQVPANPAQPGAQPVPANPGPQVVPPTQIQQGGAGQTPAAQPANGANQNQVNANATANIGGFGNFGVGASAPFFADQGIRTGMGLSEAQFGQLNQLSTRLMGDFRTQLDKLGNNLSDAERSARSQELWNTVNSQIMTDAAKVLKPEQMERFRQVSLQYRGVDAFRDPMVQQKLTLTEDQQSHLRSVREAFQKQAAGIGTLAQTNRDEALTRWQALQKEMGTRINSVLTPEQQKQWAELIGDPVQFSLQTSARTGE